MKLNIFNTNYNGSVMIYDQDFNFVSSMLIILGKK